MSLVALAFWIMTAGGGLYLLSVWLIEYDQEFQAAAATRLPPVVLVSHVLVAGGGLIIWVGYLLFDGERLAWTAVAALAIAAALGLTMAVRWIGVYRAGRALARASRASQAAARLTLVTDRSQVALLERTPHSGPPGLPGIGHPDVGPPERHFPLLVVIAHGAFALTTITLVLLTALGVGRS